MTSTPDARTAVDAEVPPRRPGSAILAAATWGTIAFVVVAVAGAIRRSSFSGAVVATSLVLFAVGCGAFLWAYATAVARSRTEEIGMGGLFFLAGSAPRAVQRHLLAALAVQTTAAVATAAVHPFTSQAFVILAPMYGLGLAGLWAARHGVFAARPPRRRA